MKPDDPAWPGITADYLTYGWDEGIEGEVRDASNVTRGQARAAYARETTGDIRDVRCVVRYVILHTRQDVWDGPGRDQWSDDLVNDSFGSLTLGEASERTPATVPDDWRPREGMACWSVCRKDHPRAIKVWMCEAVGDGQIPDTPDKVNARARGQR